MEPDVWGAGGQQQWRPGMHRQNSEPGMQRPQSVPACSTEAADMQYLLPQRQHQQPQQQHQQHRGLSTSSAAVLLLYLLLVSAGVQHLTSRRSGSSSSSRRSLAAGPVVPSPAAVDCSSSSSAAAAGPEPQCTFGSLPGTWVPSAPPGARWQLLDEACQLTNWLAVYTAAEHTSNSTGSSGSGGDSSITDSADPADASAHDPAVLADQAAAAAAAAAEAGAGSSSSDSSGVAAADAAAADAAAAGRPQPPEARILLLSDSVDRYIVTHVCNYLGGTKHTLSMSRTPASHTDDQQPAPAAEAAAAATAAAAAAAAGPGSGWAPRPSSLNKTAYAFHTCEAGVPLKLASSYFPGVHPTGPFHRGLAQDFRQRIDAARAMWLRYAGPDKPPQLVSVAALLWDVARLHLHERDRVEGRDELDLATLRGWVTNFTAVVGYARQAFPETRLWVTHTTMPPRFSPATGRMVKPYLGRRYFIDQLNAAAGAAAARLGLGLVDYAALAGRFGPGQTYLVDDIHPNSLVGLEVANLLLNLALATEQGATQQQQGAAATPEAATQQQGEAAGVGAGGG